MAVWNLGYLPNDKYEYKPGEETGERVATEESVSIPSIVQGLECVRVNGVCLVTSYPASNLKEHEKVLELGERVGRMTNREGEGGGKKRVRVGTVEWSTKSVVRVCNKSK